MTREALVDEMKAANIRGRGGAGFPMGVKWSFMPWPPKPEKPHYLVINADEGEPGTFKDRTIMEQNPHSVVEGCIIGCFGIGAHTAYIYVRDELHLSKDRLWAAIAEAKAKGYLGTKPFGDRLPGRGRRAHRRGRVHLRRGDVAPQLARGQARRAAAQAALPGAGGRLRHAQHRQQPGDHRHRAQRRWRWAATRSPSSAICTTSRTAGRRLFGVSGHVRAGRVIEACVGVTLRDLIYEVGGGVAGGELLAVIPGGSSCPILRADEVVNAPNEKSPLHPWHGRACSTCPLGVDTFRALGTMLGTCCAIVLSDKADPMLAFHNLMRFYRHESCGQCTPCREGSAWLHRILDRAVKGEATVADLDRLSEIADNIMGNTICAFGEGTAMPALGFLLKFRKEFEQHIKTRGKSATGKLALGAPGPVGELLAKLAGPRGGDRMNGIDVFSNVFFGLATLLVLVGGVVTVGAKNPIRGAMGLMTTIVGIAGMYLLLSAEFLAAIQIMVYAGAVVVLFLFVIMLLGPSATSSRDTRTWSARYLAATVFLATSLSALLGARAGRGRRHHAARAGAARARQHRGHRPRALHHRAGALRALGRAAPRRGRRRGRRRPRQAARPDHARRAPTETAPKEGAS